MSGVLDEVNRRTQLAGHNRMELLLFRLIGKQRYGINVFKVREVIQCPPLTHIPHSNPVVRGVVTIRGITIPIMDLGYAVGMVPVEDPCKCFVIVSEYNRSVQGFLVSAVERIVNMRWDDVTPPPRAAGAAYLTAVTRVDNELVEIIDVEKVLSEVMNLSTELSPGTTDGFDRNAHANRHVLVADDSSVARTQIKKTLEQLSIPCTTASNGREALDLLRHWAQQEPEKLSSLLMVISDIEMPEMDGYTLTAEIRRDPALSKIYIMLHTSLSGVFNNALVNQVGADRFIPKFQADDLGRAVMDFAQSERARR